ncbi:MAG: Rossmann-like and DUF2520 domain-containing protein [Ferruginibacter sp.]
MKIVIIGSGNVATVLGKKIKAAGHTILQVLSRNIEHAKILADQLNCKAGDYETGADMSADLYLFAVADTALFEMSKYFMLGSRLAVHTAGSVNKDVLQKVSTNYGVLYPLQSLRKEIEAVPEIPLFIDAGNNASLVILKELACSISPEVHEAGDEQRAKLHTAAVIVSNFINHLYIQAHDFCEKENLDFKVLQPLIDETALRLRAYSPRQLQTGPAMRNDVYTLQKHLQILSAHPKLKYLYVKLTDSIMNA